MYKFVVGCRLCVRMLCDWFRKMLLRVLKRVLKLVVVVVCCVNVGLMVRFMFRVNLV